MRYVKSGPKVDPTQRSDTRSDDQPVLGPPFAQSHCWSHKRVSAGRFQQPGQGGIQYTAFGGRITEQAVSNSCGTGFRKYCANVNFATEESCHFVPVFTGEKKCQSFIVSFHHQCISRFVTYSCNCHIQTITVCSGLLTCQLLVLF